MLVRTKFPSQAQEGRASALSRREGGVLQQERFGVLLACRLACGRRNLGCSCSGRAGSGACPRCGAECRSVGSVARVRRSRSQSTQILLKWNLEQEHPSLYSLISHSMTSSVRAVFVKAGRPSPSSQLLPPSTEPDSSEIEMSDCPAQPARSQSQPQQSPSSNHSLPTSSSTDTSQQSPVPSQNSSRPRAQREVERPTPEHASRKVTRDESAPYSRRTRSSSYEVEDQLVDLFEHGLGLNQSGGVGRSRRRRDGSRDRSSTTSASDLSSAGEGLTEDGDDEMSVEGERDLEWTPSHDSARTTLSRSTRAGRSNTSTSWANPSSLDNSGSPRQPEKHSHAGQDPSEARRLLTDGASAIAAVGTVVGREKARGAWIQLW